jgi:S-adenosylmethionine-diacylglycerol 3-amino-3-carboxypropyl transferase
MPQPDWLEQAAALPLAFALVREDSLLDLEVAALAGPTVRVIMVASGGCTAAALAASPNVAALHLVDPNPAQLALCQLKLHLLQTAVPAERLALLGHTPMPALQRRRQLSAALAAVGLSEGCMGPVERVAEFGPDHAGRYERLFARLRHALADHASEFDALLRLRDPAEQARRAAPSAPLGQALDAAYDDVLDLSNLVRLFGAGATQNPVEPFARHFARRTRAALATLPAADNPYLWSMLAGRFPEVPVPWLNLPVSDRRPDVEYTRGVMDEALARGPGRYDLVHLSNILDWLTPQEARRTLQLAHEALRTDGLVFVRQLNSTLDVPALGPFFRWDENAAGDLHQRDRSFFYRALHLGRKA